MRMQQGAGNRRINRQPCRDRYEEGLAHLGTNVSACAALGMPVLLHSLALHEPQDASQLLGHGPFMSRSTMSKPMQGYSLIESVANELPNRSEASYLPVCFIQP